MRSISMKRSYNFNDIKYLDDGVCFYSELVFLIYIRNAKNSEIVDAYIEREKNNEQIILSVKEIKTLFNEKNSNGLLFWSAELSDNIIKKKIMFSYFKRIKDKKFTFMIQTGNYDAAAFYAYTLKDSSKMYDCLYLLNYVINNDFEDRQDLYEEQIKSRERKLIK